MAHFFDDKKNVLLLVLLISCSILGYFLYQQNQVIEVLNQEVIKQAQKQHRTLLDKYALEKELERKTSELMVNDSLR